jgi:hypothetical protein
MLSWDPCTHRGEDEAWLERPPTRQSQDRSDHGHAQHAPPARIAQHIHVEVPAPQVPHQAQLRAWGVVVALDHPQCLVCVLHVGDARLARHRQGSGACGIKRHTQGGGTDVKSMEQHQPRISHRHEPFA